MEISELIFEIKMDKEKFVLLIERFEPLIKKYINLLYKDEKEDARAELIAALWEAVCSIDYYSDNGQVVKYISTALRNRFLELYRLSRKYHDHTIEVDEITVPDFITPDDVYNDLIIYNNMEILKKRLKGRKMQIMEMIFYKGYTDIEVADKLGISRQYVHRVKKEVLNL